MAATMDTQQTIQHESVPLPGPGKTLNLLPQDVKLKALRGEYVQMEEFLTPEFSLPSTCLSLMQDSDGNLTFQQCSNQKIQSFSDWLRAWNNYERILISYDCTLYHSLVSYRELIQNCNRKFTWPAVSTYDQSFRAFLAESKSHAFGTIHHDLYTSLFDSAAIRPNATRCFRCKSFYHKVMQCPFPSPQSPPQSETLEIIQQRPRAGGCNPHSYTLTNCIGNTSDHPSAVYCEAGQHGPDSNPHLAGSTGSHLPNQQAERGGVPPWPGASC